MNYSLFRVWLTAVTVGASLLGGHRTQAADPPITDADRATLAKCLGNAIEASSYRCIEKIDADAMPSLKYHQNGRERMETATMTRISDGRRSVILIVPTKVAQVLDFPQALPGSVPNSSADQATTLRRAIVSNAQISRVEPIPLAGKSRPGYKITGVAPDPAAEYTYWLDLDRMLPLRLIRAIKKPTPTTVTADYLAFNEQLPATTI